MFIDIMRLIQGVANAINS